MQFFKKQPTFDFMGKRKLAMIFSATLVLISIGSLIQQQLSFGIDFTGGTVIEVGYENSIVLADIRQALAGEFDDAVVQNFGTTRDVLIRIAPREGTSSAEVSVRVLEKLQAQADARVDIRRVEYVGPQVGEELAIQGTLALVYALGGILVYVWLRFIGWQFALGSVIALLHDVIITLGVFSILQLDFDLTILAAILAVIGYSLNDTIVVFDRIRENFRKMRTGNPAEVINTSLNQTLSRTMMTSMTTLLVLISLFVWGGKLINGFASALIIGVVIGTYSSIYVASNVLVVFNVSKTDLMPVKKEGADIHEGP
ncbi:MAG: protein translocase subunit SecF [Gammaproteobacteria bacterium]|nr:MAG: protein translocase subunit SecF [Gammaproteobacteria bacterium]